MRELREFEVLGNVADFLHLLQKICNNFQNFNSDGVLRSRSEPRARKRDMQPYQIRYSRLNGAVEISIRAAFLGNEIDKLALLGFKSQITEDLSGVFVSWPNDSVRLCQWTGVKCRLRHGRVTHLNLKGLRLVGTLSGHLGNLSLKKMPSSTTQQAVKASKPEFEQLLPNLQILYLAKCQFIGSIPSSLANASKSLELDFPINNFTGNIPKGFGNLRNLLWLNVWSNQFGHGKHDDLDFVNSLTNCRSLQMLHFRDNQFVGTLPHSTVNLSTQLQSLLFYGNRISGSIPKEISNLVNLNLFELSNNNLTGSIPDSIGRLTNLGGLNFGNNFLTGLGNCSQQLDRNYTTTTFCTLIPHRYLCIL
ncbi:hypothetical protein KY290_018087 [Solanum tuberosum]|uniref:Leucine-rich repeat-containing N-terminal plant-type domain-containing protein n=1 Tax=Solanum tuberosum TaxID=4113 RepID=A0ABQ7VD69_SOLTU|nr:hypothetical protein KY289_018483 [Solanum tuberosum]KAH0702770.1 hypothetical protein KY285_017048 [Solanum tuberosum]KAH0762014.1 hypothetical protein KY290_018087 [Solanum tuberosum]